MSITRRNLLKAIVVASLVAPLSFSLTPNIKQDIVFHEGKKLWRITAKMPTGDFCSVFVDYDCAHIPEVREPMYYRLRSEYQRDLEKMGFV